MGENCYASDRRLSSCTDVAFVCLNDQELTEELKCAAYVFDSDVMKGPVGQASGITQTKVTRPYTEFQLSSVLPVTLSKSLHNPPSTFLNEELGF